MVGVYRRTGKRWRNGRRIVSGGRVLNLPPVITTLPVQKRYSPRYLSEDERVRLADLRRERRTMREIAALMGRSLSTISRELARGADAAGRYPAVRGPPARRSGAAACTVPAVLPATPSCATGSRAGSRRAGARSRSPAGCAASSPTSRAMAVRGDDLPGRLSPRPRRPAPGAAGTGPASPAPSPPARAGMPGRDARARSPA